MHRPATLRPDGKQPGEKPPLTTASALLLGASGLRVLDEWSGPRRISLARYTSTTPTSVSRTPGARAVHGEQARVDPLAPQRRPQEWLCSFIIQCGQAVRGHPPGSWLRGADHRTRRGPFRTRRVQAARTCVATHRLVRVVERDEPQIQVARGMRIGTLYSRGQPRGDRLNGVGIGRGGAMNEHSAQKDPSTPVTMAAEFGTRLDDRKVGRSRHHYVLPRSRPRTMAYNNRDSCSLRFESEALIGYRGLELGCSRPVSSWSPGRATDNPRAGPNH